MNALYALWAALANLARACNRLAAVADAAADEAERKVEVIGHRSTVPALPVEEPLPVLNGTAEPARRRK